MPLLLTTTADEAGISVPNYPLAPAQDAYGFMLSNMLNPDRAAAIVASEPYRMPEGSMDARPMIMQVLTDGAWRCATREAARKWAGAGGVVYVGEFREGVHYPANDAYSICAGKVCHSVSPRTGRTVTDARTTSSRPLGAPRAHS